MFRISVEDKQEGTHMAEEVSYSYMFDGLVIFRAVNLKH